MAYITFFLSVVQNLQNSELLLEKLQVKIDAISLGSKKPSIFLKKKDILSKKLQCAFCSIII